MRFVIALGGNAMTSPDGSARPEDQRSAIRQAAGPIVDLVAAGHEVLVTHGNGPQVGNLLVKNELTAAHVPPVPLDWCGAQTQGTIGMLLINALDEILAARDIAKRSAALVSRTLVDPGDAHFIDPTKPIGRYLGQDEAQPLIEQGQHFIEVPDRGWRRVVASPAPVESLDSPAADALMTAGFVVVCSGGGGIPTLKDSDGVYSGAEAVIDKDLTAALIAQQVGADYLVIATDVEAVVADWGTPSARPIGEVTAGQMREIAADQGFASGSMGPKVDAVTAFAESGTGTGVITSLERITAAIEGRAGTRVVRAA
ncbi:carbamate kinase [Janibacter cremeus]|uniref:Carbamate kinase n=1 Tax=Janibacter cremeus TaxID=1285192 RepID=A0A852VVX6_9MICO|nr:carbamate kinase [Janibacter cremeus]NYF97915.1 carbamate kinase [Janibacter cremeus]